MQSELGLDPHSGVIVVFRSKRADRIKVLTSPHATATFTGFGVENLKNLIRIHKANPS